ncbi:MAG: AI-2E family transporter [Bacteroidota bacterium]|nr:AI-2E family transporter [Ferruginibacter sp.]
MNETPEVPFYQRLSLTLLGLVIIAFTIYVGQDILVPLAFAILFSILLLPVADFLERKGVGRVIANILCILLALLFVSGIIYFLSSQISSFLQDLPSIKKHLADHSKTVQAWIGKTFNMSRAEQSGLINDATSQIKSSGSGMLGNTVLTLTASLLLLVLLPVYIFLILYYRDMIRKFLVKVFKDEHEARVMEVLRESRSIVQGYMIGLIIEMGIVATINSLGFIILGIQYAIFLGVLAAILNMIPYIGMLIASIFCVLITLTTSTEIGDIIGVIAILTVVQFLDNNIIMPRVVSSKVKINALITILGVLVGGALAGISGMFLSIPTIAIIKVIFDRVDDLKPWGMILGDEITGSRKSKFYMKLGRLGGNSEPPAPVKPPTLE